MGNISLSVMDVLTSKAMYDIAVKGGHLDLQRFGSGWENQFHLGLHDGVAAMGWISSTNLVLGDRGYDLVISDQEELRIRQLVDDFQSSLGGLEGSTQDMILGNLAQNSSIALGITLTQLIENCQCQNTIPSKGKKRKEGFIKGTIIVPSVVRLDVSDFLIIINSKTGQGESVTIFDSNLDNQILMASLLSDFDESVECKFERSKEPETTRTNSSAVKSGSEVDRKCDKGSKNGSKHLKKTERNTNMKGITKKSDER